MAELLWNVVSKSAYLNNNWMTLRATLFTQQLHSDWLSILLLECCTAVKWWVWEYESRRARSHGVIQSGWCCIYVLYFKAAPPHSYILISWTEFLNMCRLYTSNLYFTNVIWQDVCIKTCVLMIMQLLLNCER